jgi:hypothetical protein
MVWSVCLITISAGKGKMRQDVITAAQMSSKATTSERRFATPRSVTMATFMHVFQTQDGLYSHVSSFEIVRLSQLETAAVFRSLSKMILEEQLELILM